MKKTDEQVIRAFVAVARPIILERFPVQSCIASSRIAVECLGRFGIAAAAVPVKFSLELPSRLIAYCAGESEEGKQRIRESRIGVKDAQPMVEIPSGPDSWNGHMVVAAGGFIIDASIDQAMFAFADAGKFNYSPFIGLFCIPNPVEALQGVELTVRSDEGELAIIKYIGIDDETWLNTPAWETDHLQPTINKVCVAMALAL